MLETLTANVIMSVIDILMYFVLSNAEKCVPYGELVDTTECITLRLKCCTIQGCYNRVQLYYFVYFIKMNFANSQISRQDLDPDLRSHTGFCSCDTFRSQYLKPVYEVSSAVINQYGMCFVVAWVKSWSLAVSYVYVKFFSFLFFQFYMSPQLALVGLAIVPPVAGMAVIYGRFVRKITKSVQV